MSDDSTEMLAAMRRRLSESPLWPFALALYARPDVEAACLRLQDDAGVDVCELLWRCWLLHHGAIPEHGSETGLVEVRRWQREVTAPLRRLRRELKATAAERDGVARLRETLKRAELEAEREALARLEALAMTGPLRPLDESDPAPQELLSNALQLQKKAHLSTLKRLVMRLDPPRRPR
ncbi:TIGR02444 family protein [Halomonas sp. SSL-5]|uniref:TIGR02444 family protein n=1 Tax=Halomonas sp. SSL-5 TaxID=3065855 RepID=UPI002739F190|nr:TIGR02444 family protein [Halomonas sp. SSL-5]MDY7116226.1 TIGR02444 family protein [Halomonas sp. SSL-5]